MNSQVANEEEVGFALSDEEISSYFVRLSATSVE